MFTLLPSIAASNTRTAYDSTPFQPAARPLMQAGSPDGWQSALNAWSLVRANQKEIAACSEAAAKTKKDQRCMITVPAR